MCVHMYLQSVDNCQKINEYVVLYLSINIYIYTDVCIQILLSHALGHWDCFSIVQIFETTEICYLQLTSVGNMGVGSVEPAAEGVGRSSHHEDGKDHTLDRKNGELGAQIP